MGFRPPKGVRPPQLEGKRTGRPKGSRNYAAIWAPVLWGFAHRFDAHAKPPSIEAPLWWGIASRYPDEVEEWLEACGQVRAGQPVAPITPASPPTRQEASAAG
jgi:hypothetical protein